VLSAGLMQGVIMDGGVQWMTAGRGIVHSEMPVITQGDLWGFQLWINLPAKDKMIKPRYQDYQAADIPTVSNEQGAEVRVMASTFQGVKGDPARLQTRTELKLRSMHLIKATHACPQSCALAVPSTSLSVNTCYGTTMQMHIVLLTSVELEICSGNPPRVIPKSTCVPAGPVELRNPGLLMDVKINAGGSFEHSFPSDWNAFAYVCEGEGLICESQAPVQHALVLGAGDVVKATSEQVRMLAGLDAMQHFIPAGYSHL
jgi:redox-sensitive bicupin YhaK (pirin superfamily)